MTALKLGLSSDQLAFRVRVIGGSDANTIMSGDSERILRLWREKRGEEKPEDLSDVLPVQMGSFTEPFNRYWFQKQTGRLVTHAGDERLSIDYPFMACTLDGMTDEGATVFEAKHVSAFAKEDEILARYLPQLHHNMMVCEAERAVLSVFFGTLKFAHFDVAFDPIYGAALIAAEQAFWDCVVSGDPPVAVHVAAPVHAEKIVDMTGRNEWASAAADWLANATASKTFAASEKTIKALVEADAKEAFGHGVTCKRAKNGALSIKAQKD